MKLWVLEIRDDLPRPNPWQSEENLWTEYFDKALKFVIRAETEGDARALAQREGGDEISIYPDSLSDEKIQYGIVPVWTNEKWTTCEELTGEGEPGIIASIFGGG